METNQLEGNSNIFPNLLTKNFNTKSNFKFYNDPSPHQKVLNSVTINWLRSKLNKKVVEKSVLSILPKQKTIINNDNSISKEIVKERKKIELRNWINDYLSHPVKVYKSINPKYLYHIETQHKINKIKDIFLEFDEHGFRRLRLKDICEMFKRNDINVTNEELLELFYQGRQSKKNEEPSLNFFEFMIFAISDESDQNFRNFMRKIKLRIDDKREINSNNYLFKSNDKNIFKKENQIHQNKFLPMNFNLLLDYFNNKGKDRDRCEKIQKFLKTIKNYKKSIMSNEKIENEKNEEITLEVILKCYMELIRPKNMESKPKSTNADIFNLINFQKEAFLDINDTFKKIISNEKKSRNLDETNTNLFNKYKSLKIVFNFQKDSLTETHKKNESPQSYKIKLSSHNNYKTENRNKNNDLVNNSRLEKKTNNDFLPKSLIYNINKVKFN